MNHSLKKKKILYMGLFGVMLLSGCKDNNSNNNINKKQVPISIDNQAYYPKEQIYLIFDMESGKCQEFVLKKSISNSNQVSEEIYNVLKEDVVLETNIPGDKNDIYYRYLKSLPNVVFLENLDEYLPGIIMKNYYTISEIRLLEPYIFNAILRKNEEIKDLVR